MARKSSKTQDKSAANLGFEAKLWLAADKLRNNMDAAEYKHVVLGLIFLKYISDSFEKHRAKLLAGDGDYDGANPEDPDEYRAENIFWVPTEARWAHLQANAKQPTIGKIVDDAMVAIERDKIELNRRMNATLEAMARALFQSWFVDFDPVRRNMNTAENTGLTRRREERGEQPSEAFDLRASVPPCDPSDALFPAAFQDSAFGEIPEGWSVKTIDELSLVGIGKTPPRKESRWFSRNPSDVPWMSIRDLGNTGTFITHTSEFLTPEAVDEFRIRKIPNNTVVLSFKLTIGRIAITDGEMLSNEAIAHFRLNAEATFGSPYLYCYLKNFDYDQMGGTSSIATAVNSRMVRQIKILVPSIEICAAFETTVAPIFAQIKNLQKQSHTLASLRDTLLPKLLSGEVAING